MNNKMNYLKTFFMALIASILVMPFGFISAQAIPNFDRIGLVGNYQTPLVPGEGMVTFSFDDAVRGAYNYGLPLMKKFGIKGCINPIIGPIENNEDWVVNWDELKEFQQAGWEVGSHTMTHPYLTSLSDEQINYELGESKRLLEEHGFNPQTLVFPYGDQDYRVYDYVTRYYQNARLAWGNGGFNEFPHDRYKIVTINVDYSTPPELVQQWIDKAVAEKLWLVLMLHDITLENAGPYQYNVMDLAKVLQHVRIKNVPTATMIEALDYHQNNNLIVNSNLEQTSDNWANNWTRTNDYQVSLFNGVKRVFAGQNQLHLQGGSEIYSARPQMIGLPNSSSAYLFSMFVDIKTDNSGAAIWLNEFDAEGNYLSGQWIGGMYYTTFSMPEYLYTPTSPDVASVLIDVYSEPGSVDFFGDNFYFGLLK